MTDSKTVKKCVIYARVSTAKQLEDVGEQDSIGNQIELCKRVIDLKNAGGESWELIDTFTETKSAKEMKNRTQFKNMMQLVTDGEVDVVMCKELSRISRSTQDFLGFVHVLNELGVELYCHAQQFDTTTSYGRLIVGFLMQLAEFEREQLSERVLVSTQLRAEKGLFNGGTPPTGYILDVSNKGHLLVVDEEAKHIVRLFEAYSEVRSVSETCRQMNDEMRPWRVKSGEGCVGKNKWTDQRVNSALRNKMYIGKRVRTVGVGIAKREEIYDSVWKPIVESRLFEITEKIRSQNEERSYADVPHQKNHSYLLSDLLYCKHCKSHFKPDVSNKKGKQYRRYAHKKQLDDCPMAKTMPINPIEDLILRRFDLLGEDEELLKGIVREARLKSNTLTDSWCFKY